LSSSQIDEEKIERELKGKALQVYWYILKSAGSNVGVREVQKALGFSSPRLAAYHLEKLEELGLVKNEHGEYFLVKEVKVGVLKQFVRFGAFLLPRYFFYATMFTTFLIYIIATFKEVSVYSILALILSILGTAIFWYETFQSWRQKR
jgi:hypothetical protein